MLGRPLVAVTKRGIAKRHFGTRICALVRLLQECLFGVKDSPNAWGTLLRNVINERNSRLSISR